MNPDWQALGAIGELAGAVGMLVTIVYLVVQLRLNSRALDQQTQALVAATETAGVDTANAIILELSRNADLATLVLKGSQCYESLAVDEAYRFSAFWQSAMIAHQHTFLHHERGLTSDAAWATYRRMFEHFARLPGVAVWWKKAEATFDAQFRDYMNERLVDIGARSLAADLADRASATAYPYAAESAPGRWRSQSSGKRQQPPRRPARGGS